MLGADLIGFHLQQHCNNFLDTVDRMLESRLDWDHFAVELERSRDAVRPFPISVQDWAERNVPQARPVAGRSLQLKEQHNLGGAYVVRRRRSHRLHQGPARALPRRGPVPGEVPAVSRGRYTFVQLGAPSRTHIRRYRDLIAELEALADEINWKYQTDGWKPIHFLVAHHDVPRRSTRSCTWLPMCIVSSLHDGMNLVAKEYVAAQAERDGVLVLSEFAGAARELADALIINPYDTSSSPRPSAPAVEMDADGTPRAHGAHVPASVRGAQHLPLGGQLPHHACRHPESGTWHWRLNCRYLVPNTGTQ